MALIIFGLLMGGFVVGMGVWALKKTNRIEDDALAEEQSARGWSRTEARVLQASVHDVTHGHGRYKVVKAVPEIEYEYELAGRRYRGSRVRFGVVEFNLPSSAQALVDRYRTGSTISIHYDPKQPYESVIEPVANAKTGMKVALAICWILILFGISFGLFFAYLGLTMR
jgi:hypothetical protein